MAIAPLLTRRSAVLLAMESSYDSLPTFSAATDGFYVNAPDFTSDLQVLERQTIQSSLSRRRHQIGYKLARIKFSAEMNFNGLVQSGSLTDEPIIGRMFRGCGMAHTARPAPWMSSVYPMGPMAAATTWATTATGISSYTGQPICYVITCITPGPSATAAVSIVPSDTTLDTTVSSVVLTTGSPTPLGAKGATITPTITTPLAASQQWVVTIYPKGISYAPISTGFESVGLKFFVDGGYHALSAAFGSFTIKGQAGQIVMADFEFTGRWHSYADDTFPTITYPTGTVPIMASSQLAVSSFAPIVDTLTVDIANTVSNRMSVNATDGLYGTMITARAARGGIDPEATTAANEDFWAKLESGTTSALVANFGTTIGSRLNIFAPNAQYGGITYRDRNGIRTHDIALEFTQTVGDDEFLFALS